MHIHVQPDAITAAYYLEVEKQEQIDNRKAARAVVLDSHEMGDMTIWAPKGYDKARSLKPWEKIAKDALQGFLGLKATARQEKCWMHTIDCDKLAHVWVHEVGFDLKEMDAELDFGQVNSADIDGPVPGFCMFHIAQAPAMLAQAVYEQHPLVQWGYLPNRWYVKFTDGTSTRGPIKQINPKLAQPTIMDEHLHAKG